MDGLVELIGMQKEVVIIIIATVIINIALNIIMQKEVVIILNQNGVFLLVGEGAFGGV